jgi:hypothetical protein
MAVHVRVEETGDLDDVSGTQARHAFRVSSRVMLPPATKAIADSRERGRTPD